MIEVHQLLVDDQDLLTTEDLVLILDALQLVSDGVLDAERESPYPTAWQEYQHDLLRASQRVATLILVRTCTEVRRTQDPAPGHSG